MTRARPRLRLRPLAAAGAILVALGLTACGSGEPPEPEAPRPRPTPAVPTPTSTIAAPRPEERLGARLQRPTALRADPGGSVIAQLGERTEFGSSQVLLVVDHHESWLRVRSSELPNGRTGWIDADDATLLRETWAIEIDLSRRRLVLNHQGRPYHTATVAVGAPGTTTPVGEYGVTDRLRTGSPSSPYGCCVLALTGHQPNIPQDWPGGDRLAIHGTNAPASIGRAVSHGCVRVGDDDLRVLMARVPLGTPVRVRA